MLEKEYKLTPTDVINGCAELGLEIGKRQLQRWAKAGLVTRSYQQGAGRGYGTISLYRADAPAELFASEVLMQKLKLRRNMKRVAEIRALAVTEDKQNFWRHVFDSPDNLAAAIWLMYYAKALGEQIPVKIYREGVLGSEGVITLKVLVEGDNYYRQTKFIEEKDDPEHYREWQGLLRNLWG